MKKTPSERPKIDQIGRLVENTAPSDEKQPQDQGCTGRPVDKIVKKVIVAAQKN